ncbi:MAG TPA: ABC transporter substrate-binding protein, partial [Pseudonocardia sp.]
QRYRSAYGPFAPPVSSITESVYESIHLYAKAVRRAGVDDLEATARELRGSRDDFPRGEVAVVGPETVRQRMFLAEATRGGFLVGLQG